MAILGSVCTSPLLSLPLSEEWRSWATFPVGPGLPFLLPGDTVQIFFLLTNEMGTVWLWYVHSQSSYIRLESFPQECAAHVLICNERDSWGSTFTCSHCWQTFVGVSVTSSILHIFSDDSNSGTFSAVLLIGVRSSGLSLFKISPLFSIALTVLHVSFILRNVFVFKC